MSSEQLNPSVVGDFRYTDVTYRESQLERVEERVRQRTESIHSSHSEVEQIKAISEQVIATKPVPIKVTFKNINYSVTLLKMKEEQETEVPLLPGSRNKTKTIEK